MPTLSGDLVRSVIFVLCELLLLTVFFSPVIFKKHDAPPTVPMSVKLLLFGAAVVITGITAGINLRSLIQGYGDGSFGSGAHAAAARNREPVRAWVGSNLTAEVLRGTPALIRFDPEACILFNLGTIECGSDYHGKYEAITNRWTVIGHDKDSGTVKSIASTNAPRVLGSLSVWGILSRFDDAGNIQLSDEKIGTIELDSDPTAWQLGWEAVEQPSFLYRVVRAIKRYTRL